MFDETAKNVVKEKEWKWTRAASAENWANKTASQADNNAPNRAKATETKKVIPVPISKSVV